MRRDALFARQGVPLLLCMPMPENKMIFRRDVILPVVALMLCWAFALLATPSHVWKALETIPWAVRVLLAALCLTCITLLLGAHVKRSDVETPEVEDRDEAWLFARCRPIAQAHGLTPKETEVAISAYRGFTLQKTADSLGISKNTADTHLRHVYKKLGIHSKQELIDLIDASPANSKR